MSGGTSALGIPWQMWLLSVPCLSNGMPILSAGNCLVSGPGRIKDKIQWQYCNKITFLEMALEAYKHLQPDWAIGIRSCQVHNSFPLIEISTKCNQQATTWIGMFKSWPPNISKKKSAKPSSKFQFSQQKSTTRILQHTLSCPNRAFRLGLQWPKKKKQKNIKSNKSSAPSDNRARNFRNAKVSPTCASSSALINGKSWLW